MRSLQIIFRSKLFSSLFYQVTLTAISRLVTLLNSIYAVKTLGSYNIGLSNLIQTSVNQTSVVYDGGLNNVGIRKIVETNGENLEIGFQILSFRLFFGLLCSICWFIVIIAVKPQNPNIWYFGSLGIILTSLDFSFFFRAINKFNLFISFFSLTPLITAVSYRIFLSNSSQIGLDYVIYIFSTLLISITVFSFIRINYGNPFRGFLNFRSHKKLVFENKQLWLSSVLGIVYPSFQIFTISYLLGLSQNGIYKSSLMFIAPFELLNFLLSGTILPIITKWKEFGLKIFKNNIYKMFYILAFLLTPVLIVVVIFPENIITKLLGEKYVFSFLVLKIALFGKILVLIFSPFYYTIIANRHDSLNLKYSILNSSVNILLCFTLIPFLGIIGAALSMMSCDILISFMAFNNFLKIKQINYQ